MKGLIGNERAQWEHEQGRDVVAQRASRRMQVKDQRLAAAGGHDGQAALTGSKGLERFHLRLMELTIAEEGTNERGIEIIGIESAELLAGQAAGLGTGLSLRRSASARHEHVDAHGAALIATGDIGDFDVVLDA